MFDKLAEGAQAARLHCAAGAKSATASFALRAHCRRAACAPSVARLLLMDILRTSA